MLAAFCVPLSSVKWGRSGLWGSGPELPHGCWHPKVHEEVLEGGAGLGTGSRGAEPCSEDALRGLGHVCAFWDMAAGRGLPFLSPLCTGIPVPAVPSPFPPGGGAEPRPSLGVSPWPPAACLPLAAAGCRAVLGQEPQPPQRAGSSPPSCVLHPSSPQRGQRRSEHPVRNLVTILPLGENTAAKS